MGRSVEPLPNRNSNPSRMGSLRAGPQKRGWTLGESLQRGENVVGPARAGMNRPKWALSDWTDAVARPMGGMNRVGNGRGRCPERLAPRGRG